MSHTDDYFESLFNHPMRLKNDCFMREIMWDYRNNKFIDLTNEDDFEYIDNIFTEISPLHIEIFKSRLYDMIIKDRHGRLTLLTVMPLID